MVGVSEEVKETEEYVRQFEGTGRASRAGARTSGRDSLMTVTSSGQSDRSGDTLRPSPPADLGTSHSASLSSLPPVLALSQHTEPRGDGTGAVYTKMRPVFHHTTASFNDGRRKSDFYSFSSSQGGFFKPGNGASEPRASEANCSYLQESCSDRVNQMERLTRPSPSHAPAISPVVRTRSPGDTEDEFHLSNSVTNLLSDRSEAASAQAQADEEVKEDNEEIEENDNDIGEKEGETGYVKFVRDNARTLDDISGYMRTKWAGCQLTKPRKEKKVLKKKKSVPQKSKKKGFSNEDIALAATILYSSRRVYNLLRNKKIVRLPHTRTVYKKLQHFQCAPGYSKQIFRLLEMKLSTLEEKNRVIAISFDEMHLEQKYSWSPLLRRLFGKHKV